MTFGNYYNMNMMNNGWGGLIQQGLGMFGGGSYNMMGMGGSIFMNCFGEPNYSAMAGFGVASALLNVVGQATTSILAEKQAEKESAVDYKDRIDEIDEEIEELRNTDPEKAIDAHFDKDIETAKTNLDTANKALKDANKSKAELEAQLASATTDEEKAKIQKQIDALDIDKKQAEFDKLSGGEEVKGSVKYYEKQKADAIAKKEEEIK